jgi:hypothetical protein
MIAGNVDDPCAFAEQVHDLFDHLHVWSRKIALAELPSVNDITIQN